jgi:hypothetical protein
MQYLADKQRGNLWSCSTVFHLVRPNPDRDENQAVKSRVVIEFFRGHLEPKYVSEIPGGHLVDIYRRAIRDFSMKNESGTDTSSGLFLLYEGLPPTIIESQVLAHARSMNEVGIRMEVWAFAVTSDAYRKALSALPSLVKTYPTIVIRLFRGIKPALPFSEWLNALVLLWRMWQLGVRPSFVHARTEHATAIASIAKRIMKFRLIWDARGDALSEFVETARNLPRYMRLLAPLKMRAISKRIQMSARYCDSAIFVSDALRNLQGSSLSDEKVLIVPCLADESLFYFDQKLREEMRRKLGYSDENIVISYVGSTATWQCVPETIALIEKALRANLACRALIVTPDRAKFENAFDDNLHDRVCITSSSLVEINRYLNAADFGVLLRRPTAINWVASPVKFAEYSLSGLIVVTTDAVKQLKEFGQKLSNTINTSQLMDLYVNKNLKPDGRMELAEKARIDLGRNSHIDKLVRFYNR